MRKVLTEYVWSERGTHAITHPELFDLLPLLSKSCGTSGCSDGIGAAVEIVKKASIASDFFGLRTAKKCRGRFKTSKGLVRECVE